VKLVREGSNITGYASADGVEWTLFADASPDNSGGAISNPQVVEMADPVLIGLFVTSHADGENRTFTFDNVSIAGGVDGVLVSQDIASVSGNSAESIYVALEDAAGNSASVAHPYPAATQITANRGWRIPLSDFAGVDVTAAAKLYVGVGDGEPGGAGAITISNIRVVKGVSAGPKDITQPSDIIKGVPNDGDWPGAEYPALAFDNNVNTKFLHFKGDFVPDPGTGGSGLQITPLDGASVVTGLTLTTANDTPGRDPIAFELSGSNDSIDGPYTLIAAGDIVDFAGEAEWLRYTKNATPITFANDVAYAHYQLIFTTIRGPVGGGVNSMQIAEVELLGTLAAPAAGPLLSVVRSGGVSGDRDPIGAYDGNTQPLPTEAGGLKDGNMVYSDRTYPWSGIPAEYEGSEYIRTFNSDKNGGTVDVTYEVTLSRPAILWVTIDDRIPAEWNAGGAVASPQDAVDYITAASLPAGTFADTGIDIYVHENDTTDRSMSVYAAELPAGTYIFTSMDSGKNFYSIGAVE
jgi:hypothetical protein